MAKKLNIGQNAKVVVQWNVKPVDYSKTKADEIITKMASKYGIPKKNVLVEPNFIKKNVDGKDEVATADIVQNIQDPRFQQNLFKAYIDENEITDCDMDIILSIDNQLNSLIDYGAYDKFRRYKIEWVRWSNFLSYGEDNYIDFSQLSGLVLLKSEPANQGGKTNFACDLIEFLLFGSVGSGKADVLKKIFNKHLPEATEVKVEGGIEIDGEHYIIRRRLTRPKKKGRQHNHTVTQKVEYFKVVEGTEMVLDDTENLEGESNTKTNQIIKEAIGNKKDFNLVVSANSDNLKELVSMKDTERGKLLSRWIGLLPLEEKNIKAREKYNKEIKPSFLCEKYNVETLNTEISAYQTAISDKEANITALEAKVAECDRQIEAFKNESNELTQLIMPVNPQISHLDVVTLETRLNNLVSEGKGLKKQIEQAQAEINAVGPTDYSVEEFHQLSEYRIQLVNDLASIKADINLLKAQNKTLANSEYCPTCGQKLVNVDNSAAIKLNEEKIQSLINTGVEKNNELTALTARLHELEIFRDNAITKNRLELKVSGMNLEVERKRNDYTATAAQIKELNSNKAAIENNNKLTCRINIIAANITNEEKTKLLHAGEIGFYKRDIEAYKTEISNRQILIEKLEEEAIIKKAWDCYLDMVGKNGICKMVLRNVLPVINGELKRLLSDVCDFDVEVEIDDRNDITFSILADDVKSDLSSGSGFEQTVAALALRAVLGNISTMSRPSFMLLDEVLGGVAKDNYENIKKLYDRMLKDYSFIFQVTHLEDIADWHDTTVVVKKENRVSTISIL